jgi:hypothetical protein
VVLGLSDDDFFRLTPRAFHLLLDQQQHITQRTELLNGILCSTVANYSMARGKTPAKSTDFMPSYWDAKATQPKRMRKPTAKQLEAQVRKAFSIFNK